MDHIIVCTNLAALLALDELVLELPLLATVIIVLRHEALNIFVIYVNAVPDALERDILVKSHLAAYQLRNFGQDLAVGFAENVVKHFRDGVDLVLADFKRLKKIVSVYSRKYVTLPQSLIGLGEHLV